MSDKNNLRKMSRKDLLELLVLQSKKIDELEEELNRLNELLECKNILISEAGSIAEASLKLNKIFEVAQASADQYLDNIKRMEKECNKKIVAKKDNKNKIIL